MSRCVGKRYLLILVLGGLGFASNADAQLFGERSVGRPVARRPGAANAQNAPAPAGPTLESIGVMVDESARYVRGNREVTDFVGSAGTEGSRFVGALQAGAGELVQSAVDDSLQIETGTEVNRVIEPVIPARMRLNAPRLELGFSVRSQPADVMHPTVLRRLQTSLPGLDPGQFEVSVAEGVAILRGTVASERDRKMAALLVGFEPGIGRVQNELTVVPPAWTPEGPEPGNIPAADGLR